MTESASTAAGPRIGLALGGGGAKGLAHIALLEVLDDLGVRPAAIAGTSIGAIMGALYASGNSARTIHDEIIRLVRLPRSLQEAIETKRFFAWLEFFDLNISRSGIFEVDKFLDALEEMIGVREFGDLPTTLKVVATDFWKREEVVFDSGPIVPAVAASFALPGIFQPVVRDERVLVDGGSVNPVPYDLLVDECDIVIAIDVLGRRSPSDDLLPSYIESVFNTFQIAEKSILREKIRRRPPEIFIEVEIESVRMLEFHKVETIFEQAEPACRKLADEVRALTGSAAN